MNSFASAVASYVFNAAWQVPFLAGTGWLICRLVKRLGTPAEHRVWVAILFASAVLPAVRPTNLLSAAFVTPADGLATVRLLESQPVAMRQAATLSLPSGMIAAVMGLYLVVFVFFLVRFTVALVATAGLVKRSSPLHLAAAYAEVWDEANLPSVWILSSSRISGPVTLWVGRSVLLVPEDFAENTSVQDFRVAIAHECAHGKRQDCLKNLFYEVVSLFTAFHPVTWLIKAQIAQTREMTCDAMAVEAVGESRVYVESLLRLASAIAYCPPAANPYAIGIFDANILEKRIMTLRAKKETVSRASRYGLMFVGSLCLFLAMAGGASAAVGLSSRRSGNVASGQAGDKIYTIGDGVSAPVVTYAKNPEYPKGEEQNGTFEGKCLIGLVVDASGMPRDVHVLRSLSQDFDEKAIEAVEGYRFKPVQHDGGPVAVKLVVEINFRKF